MKKVTKSGLLFSLLVSTSLVLGGPAQAHSGHGHTAHGPRWHSGLSIQYHYPPRPAQHRHYGHPRHKPHFRHGHHSQHEHGHRRGHGGRKIVSKHFR